MAKRIGCFTFIFLLALQCEAFDKILCDSSMKSWSVHTSLKSHQGVVLNAVQQSVKLDKKKSTMLLVRDNQGRQIASVLPWNGVTFLKGKTATKEQYKFDFKSDDYSWFTVDISEPKSKSKHSLSCRMTF